MPSFILKLLTGLLTGVGARLAKMLTADMFIELLKTLVKLWLDNYQEQAKKTPDLKDDRNAEAMQKLYDKMVSILEEK